MKFQESEAPMTKDQAIKQAYEALAQIASYAQQNQDLMHCKHCGWSGEQKDCIFVGGEYDDSDPQCPNDECPYFTKTSFAEIDGEKVEISLNGRAYVEWRESEEIAAEALSSLRPF